MARPKKPSPYPTDEHREVLTIVDEYRNEAEQARRTRLKKNQQNYDIFMGNIDWSHKQEGQSTEHLPKLANSAEQMTAFIRRGLTQFGPWFTVDAPRNSPLTPEQIRALMMRFLDRVVIARGKTATFSTLVGDAVKQALLESLMIFKVHGTYLTETKLKVEPGITLGAPETLAKDESQVWRLRIDLISTEDYYPDPTGRNLYEIHEVERDWIDVWNMTSEYDGPYDKKVVERIYDDMEKEERLRLRARNKGQDEATTPTRRRRMQLRECWGTLLGPDGRPIDGGEDVCTTVANGKYVIREPHPISDVYWDGKSPIVAVPVMRVPHSTWHKALFDNAAALNLALDELYNLILDGGIGSVWGVRQVREEWLADPRQISNGIPQGATLLVSEDAPVDAEVVQMVSAGKVPPEALAVFQMTDREHTQSSLSNDVRLGNLPQRQTKATEIVSAENNSSVLLDAFAGDLENEAIEPVLEKAWLRMMQFADDIPAQDVVDAIGVGAAFKLSRMSPPQRYAMFAQGLKFKVSGLSATLARAREFQKLMAMNQGVATNPLLLQAFMARFSGDKMLSHIMRSLNINPEDLEQSEEEVSAQPERNAQIQQLSQITGGGTPATGGGEPQSASRSEINQEAAPTSGVG